MESERWERGDDTDSRLTSDDGDRGAVSVSVIGGVVVEDCLTQPIGGRIRTCSKAKTGWQLSAFRKSADSWEKSQRIPHPSSSFLSPFHLPSLLSTLFSFSTAPLLNPLSLIRILQENKSATAVEQDRVRAATSLTRI